MRVVFGMVLSMFFALSSALYAMDGREPSSPSKRMISIDDIYGIALFIGCCIQDVPHYVQNALRQQEEPVETLRSPRSPWQGNLANSMVMLNTKTKNN